MRNVFILILLAFIISCNSNGKDDIVLEEEKDISYSFVKIEYHAQNNSREFFFLHVPTITFTNRGNVEQTYSFNPGDSYSDSSCFKSEDDGMYEIGDIELFVPIYIDENNAISLGAKKWKYTYETQQQKSSLNFFQSITVPPNSEVIIESKMFFRKYTVNYKLFLKGNQTGKERIIEGNWMGTFLDYPEINISRKTIQNPF